MRTVPGQIHARVIAQLQQLLGTEVELAASVDVDALYTEPSHPWVQSLYDAAARHLGERPQPKAASYFTDAAELNRAYRDIPIAILGPGEPQLAHQTDEYCLLDRIEQAAEIYAQLIREWSL
jgi:succinyl-diaminopimelate desuccinylase